MTITIKTPYTLPEPITVRVYVDGELDNCNHAGAELEYVVMQMYNAIRGDVDDYESVTYVCDKCHAQSDDLVEWRDEA